MPVIAINFNKMLVERKNPQAGKINISNSVNIDSISEVSINITNEKEPALRFGFTFKTEYQKDIAFVEINGEVLYVADKKVIDKVLKDWKEKKAIDENIKADVLNIVLARANIAALLITREFNLPSPIPLPRVEERAKEKKENGKR